MIDREVIQDTVTLKRVQLCDLEDSVILPEGKFLQDGTCGNQFWRSPESWAKAAQGTQSDMFSFGIVVSALSTLIIIKSMSDAGFFHLAFRNFKNRISQGLPWK